MKANRGATKNLKKTSVRQQKRKQAKQCIELSHCIFFVKPCIMASENVGVLLSANPECQKHDRFQFRRKSSGLPVCHAGAVLLLFVEMNENSYLSARDKQNNSCCRGRGILIS